MRRLKRNNIYETTWLKLFEDFVHSSERGYETYSLVEIMPGIIVLPIDSKENTYLVKEYRYAVQKVTEDGRSAIPLSQARGIVRLFNNLFRTPPKSNQSM